MHSLRERSIVGLVALACVGAGCSPVFNWREVRTNNDVLKALMPCKPERQVRSLPLDGVMASMEVLSCSAGGVAWAVSSADVGDAARVPGVLAWLRKSRLRNLEGRETAVSDLPATAHGPRAGLRITIVGHFPDGGEAVDQSAVFAQGSRVFHAVALGGAPPRQVLDTFFEGLELQS